MTSYLRTAGSRSRSAGTSGPGRLHSALDHPGLSGIGGRRRPLARAAGPDSGRGRSAQLGALDETLTKAGGRGDPTALRERVLAPLGMMHTTAHTAPGTPDGAILPFRTAGTPVVPRTNPKWAAVGTGTWTASADLATNTAPNPPAALALTPTPRDPVADHTGRDARIGLGLAAVERRWHVAPRPAGTTG
ncbi:hypothetical protein V7793_06330 [Streptomyces sp. KLMMK]|uniref:hypothetical protein n=1 Tax=Streptomyces sp. KLMMK TaxID=3109353 RepID=UPI002FFD7972